MYQLQKIHLIQIIIIWLNLIRINNKFKFSRNQMIKRMIKKKLQLDQFGS